MAGRRNTALVILAVLCSIFQDALSQDNPVKGTTITNVNSENYTVLTEEGILQGRRINSVAGGTYYSFEGIPYAQSPVGPLRFKDPQNPSRWQGIREAFTEGNVCPQPAEEKTTQRSEGIEVFGNEDCLFLNVYTPVLPPLVDASLPVMVYIHGGGFVYGAGNTDNLGPDYLIAEDVIIVTFNHRLGVFGFLYLDEAAPGNVGMKDQVAALRWVQRNIAAFGGDPAKVTIFGISAGGSSVHLHMLSPLSRGLFHAAIAQSGNALNPWAVQTAPAETTRRLARAVDCSVGNDSATVECLRAVDFKTLVQAAYSRSATEENNDRIVYFTFVPTVDLQVPGVETFLPAPPVQLIAEGRHNQVPFITGFTNNEASLHLAFVNFFNDSLAQEWDGRWNTSIIPELRLPLNGSRNGQALQALRDFFMNGQPLSNSTMPGFFNMLSDISFDEGIYYSVNYMSQHNSSPVYVYMFVIDDSLNADQIQTNTTFLTGASHGDELGYLFRMPFLPEVAMNSTAWIERARMVRLWTNFAKYRNPTPHYDPLLEITWKTYNESKSFIEIGSELRLGTHPNGKRMQFWNNFYENFSIQ